MFGIDFSEILVIFGVALVVLGPERLPKLAATIGRWIGRARAMARQFKDQLEQEANTLHRSVDLGPEFRGHSAASPTATPRIRPVASSQLPPASAPVPPANGAGANDAEAVPHAGTPAAAPSGTASTFIPGVGSPEEFGLADTYPAALAAWQPDPAESAVNGHSAPAVAAPAQGATTSAGAPAAPAPEPIGSTPGHEPQQQALWPPDQSS